MPNLLYAMSESYASQSKPFRFRFTSSNPKPLSYAQYRAKIIGARERSKIDWEKKKELQRLENPITYEIVPASTPGFVHLHRVAATRGVITSDTWETVPENDLKVDLYRVRMADNPGPLPQPNLHSLNGPARINKEENSLLQREMYMSNTTALSPRNLSLINQP